jgi:spore germination protein KC
MRKIGYVLLSCTLLLLQTGCWDAKEIQSVYYATAIGVDYEDNKYVIYLQLVDFASVAKIEGAKPVKAAVWVGKGTGKTVNEAVNDLYTTSEQLVFWGNVTAIVFSERMLMKGINEVLDLTNRYREIRYTKWVFGTNVPIEHLLSITPFFSQSSLSTILHEPVNAYRQMSYIKPIRMNAFIAEYHEPMTIMLPHISTTKKAWVENEKPDEVLFIKGAYLIDDVQIRKLSRASLLGVRWMQRSSLRDPILINSKGKPAATLIASKPKHKISWKLDKGKLKFHLNVHVSSIVNELLQDMNVPEIKKKASKAIEKEIRNTYLKGLEMEADPLNLGYEVYKEKPSVWHEHWDGGKFPLEQSSLGSIDVHVTLKNSGKYKLKR